jgi:hypothetical protein
MLSGTSLIITIEESELDKKALYTIQESKPGFILPFRTRHIDGKIELTYQPATLCKLQYFTGDCTVKEYVRLWSNILSPLLECDDWFMKIQSFVLDAEHLYYDKDKKSVSFVYIPTVRNFSEFEGLKKMADELVKQLSVTDIVLENKALRMIMNGFMPKEFLNMLNEYIPEAEQRVVASQKKEPLVELPLSGPPSLDMPLISSSLKEILPKPYVSEPATLERGKKDFAVFEDGNDSIKDIIINMPSDYKGRKKKKEKKKSSDKKEKSRRKESKKGFSMTSNINAEKLSYKTSIDDGLIKDLGINPISEVQTIQENELLDDATQFIRILDCEYGLRLIGNPLLPSLIKIELEDGELFTIGRYDATVGRQQSNFEFERKTKAISRRHAAIKKQSESYSLIDLSSSAGTYLDGQKLPPNTPLELKNGARVSFGTCGADYVFELREEV